MPKDVEGRSEFLYELIEKYAQKSDTILEVGCGDYRNVNFLKEKGYNIEGIDKIYGTAIENVEEKQYDIIFTMSTLFLIPDIQKITEKIERMAKKYIITIEGEHTIHPVIGRDYSKIFKNQVEHIENVFNKYGHARVFKING